MSMLSTPVATTADALPVVSKPFTSDDAESLISADGKSISIPATFTSIADGDLRFGVFTPDTFKSLETVIIPRSITYIGEYAFHQCWALKNINLPDSITSIGMEAFSECSALQDINLPDSITSIGGDWSFYRCLSLQNINLPASLTSIECTSLKSITISDTALNNPNYGMNSYGNFCDPFEGCDALIAIAQSLNMNVKQYLLHLNKEERVRRRIPVLICLKRINDRRMRDSEEANKRSKLNDGGSSSSSSGGGDHVQVWDQELNGVLAEEKIYAFDMWREIIGFL